MQRHVYVAVPLVAAALLGSGCGSDKTSSDQISATPAPVKHAAAKTAKISVQVSAPADGTTVRTAETAVRGTVTPSDATVQVMGKTASVKDGVFHVRVRLSPGDNAVDVVASAPKLSPTTTSLTITRGRTKAQIAAAVQRQQAAAARREEARKARAAARAKRRQQRSADAQQEAAGFAMPNEIGKGLQEAQDDVQAASGNPLFFTGSTDASGAGRMQILDRNWKVCSQNVPPGTPVTDDADISFSAVKLDESCP